MKNLRIVGLNLDIIWKSKSENFKQIEQAFLNENGDVFMLPEMFSTGFCMEPDQIADQNEESLSWMKSFSKKKNAAIVGSAAVKEGEYYFNRMYFVEPSGKVTHYDKRHLFSYASEDKVYSPGNKRVIVDYKGFRILLQVCYDLRFPVFSRNKEDYDLALYVANWPEKRVDAWLSLLKARAIENQAYVLGLNRIGSDPSGLHYIESSRGFFPDGSEISNKVGNLINWEISLEKLENFKARFSFFEDRDSFTVLDS